MDSSDKNNDISFLKLVHPETRESLVLVPELGGTIVSLTLGNGLHQILESDKDDELPVNPLFRGRLLFPFNDRIPDGKYSFQEKKYQLPINCGEDGSAIHGFIYNKDLTILEQTETRASLYWRTGKEKITGYPFDISLKTEIEIHNGGAALAFTVINEGTMPAPYALGWHSYFKIDTASALQAEYPCYFKTDKNFLPIGNCLPTTGTRFDFTSPSPSDTNLAEVLIDHTFRVPSEGNSILRNRDYSIRIKQQNFAYTQLFIPPDKKSIAIEPISSKPNSFNSDEVLVLPPMEEYFAYVSIDLL